MTKKYQLRNKMKVILVESHKSPVVSVQLWVKTGSADEKKGEEGLSHFIEHLVFKGTRKFKVGEVASAIETAGGDINAYTSFDQTVFHVTLSKHFLDTGLEVISEMVGHPLFD
jgi:zinc protease